MLIQKAIILFLHKKQSHSIYVAQKFEKEKPWQTEHTQNYDKQNFDKLKERLIGTNCQPFVKFIKLLLYMVMLMDVQYFKQHCGCIDNSRPFILGLMYGSQWSWFNGLNHSWQQWSIMWWRTNSLKRWLKNKKYNINKYFLSIPRNNVSVSLLPFQSFQLSARPSPRMPTH